MRFRAAFLAGITTLAGGLALLPCTIARRAAPFLDGFEVKFAHRVREDSEKESSPDSSSSSSSFERGFLPPQDAIAQLLFSRFGAFIVVTSIASLAWALVALPAALLCLGHATVQPQQDRASHEARAPRLDAPPPTTTTTTSQWHRLLSFATPTRAPDHRAYELVNTASRTTAADAANPYC